MNLQSVSILTKSKLDPVRMESLIPLVNDIRTLSELSEDMSFIELTDVPSSYTGAGGYFLRVDGGETGIEFVDPATVAVSSFDNDAGYLVPADFGITTDYIPKGDGTLIVDGTWQFSTNDLLPNTAGSNLGSATNYIGTLFIDETIRYADNLIFSEAGTERGRFKNGNFGINTNSPTSLFHLKHTGITPGDSIFSVEGSLFVTSSTSFNINSYGAVGIGGPAATNTTLLITATGNAVFRAEQGGYTLAELKANGNNDSFFFLYADDGGRISHGFQDNGGKSFIDNAGGGLVVGSQTGSTSAILEAISTTKGIRFPNMTTAQKNAIGSLDEGLVIYDTDLNKLCLYAGAWETITSV